MIKPPLHSGSITCADCGSSVSSNWQVITGDLWVGWGKCSACDSLVCSFYTLGVWDEASLRAGHQFLLRYIPDLPSPVKGGRLFVRS